MKRIPEKKSLLELEIIDLTEEGNGVGKKDGFTWFVKGALPGDVVKCHVTKVNKTFGKADAVSFVKTSENRVEPLCRYFGECGGCQIQDYDYKAQLAFKKDSVYNVLMRIGGFEKPIVRDTLGMKDPYRFRNKGAYAVTANGADTSVGFYQMGSHKIVDVEDCLIQNMKHRAVLAAFRKYLSDFDVPAYNERTKKGLIKHLVIRQSEITGEMMVIVVTAKKKIPMTDKLVMLLREACPEIKAVVQNLQPEHTSEILGEVCYQLYGESFIFDVMGDLKFQISPLSFYQVNAPQAKRLYDTALHAAELTGEETVLDLYCGTGTLSLFLAQQAKAVYGVEISGQAIEDAKRNAELNQMENTHFILGRSEIEAPKLYASGIEADVVVLDPPRSGCEESVLNCIKDMLPNRVVYVSCKPSTMARDLKILCMEDDYKLQWVQPVDMFGHATSVEAVALLTRGE